MNTVHEHSELAGKLFTEDESTIYVVPVSISSLWMNSMGSPTNQSI
jgi:hypothetical protein